MSDYEFVIVGSGVAGALIADRLTAAGRRVLILEAGETISRAASVERYRRDLRHSPDSAYRRLAHASYPKKNDQDPYLQIRGETTYWTDYLRAVGGTTWRWSGITPRWLPNDLRLRSRFGVGVDWPFGYDELEPWYLRAERELGVSGDSDDVQGSPRSGPYPMPPLAMPYGDRMINERIRDIGMQLKVLPAARNSVPHAGRAACCGANSCTPICPTGASYSADIHIQRAVKQGAKLLANAVAYQFDCTADQRISAVRYKRPDGSEGRVSGASVVLACNGIETPKLMLMARSEQAPDGIGNHHGNVGRYLMDHPSLMVAFETPFPVYGGRGPRVISGLDYGRDGGFRRGSAAGKYFLLNEIDMLPLASRLIEQERDWLHLNQRLRRLAGHYNALAVELEQLPDRSNTVRPSDSEFDALGLPKPEVRMRLGDYVQRGADHHQAVIQRILARLDARLMEEVPLGVNWPAHPMGTTRIGTDPRQSVVDPDCRCHQHPNLYIAGSAVFPTGGTANPTLTLAALSLRLAGHLLAAEAANTG